MEVGEHLYTERQRTDSTLQTRRLKGGGEELVTGRKHTAQLEVGLSWLSGFLLSSQLGA